MKKGMDRYASKKRYVKKGYLRKHSNRSPLWQANQTGGSYSLLKSGKEQEEIIKEVVNESIREENVGETHQQGRQGIQITDQRRSETEEINQSHERKKIVKKETLKHIKHEKKESKAFEKKEDKKEKKKGK